MSKDQNLARDIVQDVFEKVLNKMGQLDQSVKLSYWLHACIRNRVLNHIRNEHIREGHLEYLGKFHSTPECTTDHLLREDEMKRLIEEAITKLPPRMRETFELSQKSLMSVFEIAKETSTTVNTVRKTMQNALKRLRDTLTPAVFITTVSSYIIHNFLG
jgi:RNA polymerase sigma-70 factor (ECF subfamily)